jgi:hypothetical protein
MRAATTFGGEPFIKLLEVTPKESHPLCLPDDCLVDLGNRVWISQ